MTEQLNSRIVSVVLSVGIISIAMVVGATIEKVRSHGEQLIRIQQDVEELRDIKSELKAIRVSLDLHVETQRAKP